MSIMASHTVLGPIDSQSPQAQQAFLDRRFGPDGYRVVDTAVANLPDRRVILVINLDVWDNNFYTVLFDTTNRSGSAVQVNTFLLGEPLFQKPAAVLAGALAGPLGSGPF